jgi:hypothetical protein
VLQGEIHRDTALSVTELSPKTGKKEEKMEIKPKKVNGIKALIDEGGALSCSIKIKQQRLDEIKTLIRSHAKYRKSRTIQGNMFVAKATINTQTSADVNRVHKFLGTRRFKEVVKVCIPLLRGMLGDESEKFIDKDETEYAVISFKRK